MTDLVHASDTSHFISPPPVLQCAGQNDVPMSSCNDGLCEFASHGILIKVQTSARLIIARESCQISHPVLPPVLEATFSLQQISAAEIDPDFAVAFQLHFG